jgi:CRISPR-associated protein Cas2
MYCIVVYDINIKKVPKINKILRKYLYWIQNSVFEGEISESDLMELEIELSRSLDPNADSVIIFTFDKPKWINKKILGKEKGSVSNII